MKAFSQLATKSLRNALAHSKPGSTSAEDAYFGVQSLYIIDYLLSRTRAEMTSTEFASR